ncbi:MAG: NAD-glutamate dehydrogenase [Leptolyngbyaceae cyanobacterium RU_5_1]|nr:NAD-glutamate dehydrogenase [Leptolyngbyaceae cyanobacterium RU_5_1]
MVSRPRNRDRPPRTVASQPGSPHLSVIQEWLTQHEQAIARHEQEMAEIRAMQQLNQEQLALLTAGLLDLRNLVSDYLQGRSQL